MLISHTKKFLFIHIYKNAGTSINVALLPHCAGLIHRTYVKASIRLNIPVPSKINPFLYATHIKAKSVVKKMGMDEFQRYFSFAVVRNPWDWQVSQYKYMKKNKKHFQHDIIRKMADFDEYIVWRCNYDVRYQKDYLVSENDELLVNYIARYESLEEDFEKVCSRLGIEAQLPRLNVSNHIPYQEYYTTQTRDLVAKTFVRDIEYFGYEFD